MLGRDTPENAFPKGAEGGRHSCATRGRFANAARKLRKLKGAAFCQLLAPWAPNFETRTLLLRIPEKNIPAISAGGSGDVVHVVLYSFSHHPCVRITNFG